MSNIWKTIRKVSALWRRRSRVHRYLLGSILAASLSAGLFLAGCGAAKADDDDDKVKDLEFQVVERAEIPEELAKLIMQKEKTPFKLTYNDGKSLFIAIGYGEQETGGYSIKVDDLYLGKNAIYVDTELIGPSKEEQKGNEKSMPYIVLKTEFMEEPVVFD